MKRLTVVGLGLLLHAACSGPSSPSTLQQRVQTRPSIDRPGAQAQTASTAEYFGGPVVPNAKVYVVWWGDPSKLNPAITAAHGGIADFFAGVLNSNFLDWLNEYDTDIAIQAGSKKGGQGTGQHIGRGSFAGTVTLSAIPSGNVTDAQVQSTLHQAFAAGTLPPPDDNTLYAIYFPSSVSVDLPGSGSSCGMWLAYHNATTETQGHPAYYLVMPDCGDGFSGVTVTSSHELMEAITDAVPTPGNNPDYPQAWNASDGSEVGDLCEGSGGSVTTALGTFDVQGIWDNASSGCVAFRSDAQDFNVVLSQPTGALAQGGSATFTVQTTTVAGQPEPLELSVAVPPGVTASLSPSSLASGGTATLTLTADVSALVKDGQVVVEAAGATSGAPRRHSASLLVQVGASH